MIDEFLKFFIILTIKVGGPVGEHVIVRSCVCLCKTFTLQIAKERIVCTYDLTMYIITTTLQFPAMRCTWSCCFPYIPYVRE